MLFIASALKMLAEIALLSLLGQWLLGLLIGAHKDRNLFYQILQLASRPLVALTRRCTPRVVLDRHLPLVTFVLLMLLWLSVTAFKIGACLRIGVAQCQ